MSTKIKQPATVQAILERQEEITQEVERLAKFDKLTASQEASVDQLTSEFEALTRHRVALAWGGVDAGLGIEGPDQGASRMSGARDEDRASRVIDQAFRSGSLPDHAAERAERLLEQGGTHERGLAARWTVAAGDEVYVSAFAKLCADPLRGHLLWDGPEQEAFQRVAAVQSEMRAMSLTDSAGGFMVPLTLDPAILISNAGTTNAVRQVARVVQTMTDTWQGVTSAGATAEWKAESAEAADGSPSIGSVPIPTHMGSAFVPYSYEVGMDALNFVSELQKVLADAAANLQAAAFTTGSGSGQPTGFIKALDGTASEVAPASAEAFSVSDPYRLLESLPARFRPNATWMANLSILNLLDQFETSNGAKKYPDLGGADPMLLRRAVLENSDMDGTWNSAATADNFVLAIGDFNEFVIADRVGASMELIPHLFGENGRPTGQRGAHLWFRTGSNVTMTNAFRMLNIATIA
jgi:HK97 family phage major capsid protein